MKRWCQVCTLVAAFVAGAFLAPVARSTAGDPTEHAEKQPSPEEMAKMMEKYMAMMKPGKHHKELDQLAGEWNAVNRWYMGGPGTQPTETKGTAKRRWVLDGRFLFEEVKSALMMPNDKGEMTSMPFEGLSMVGYDNYRNMFVGTWADTMGTQILTYAGAPNPDGKTFTYYGEMDEPTLDMRGRMVKYVTRVVSKDKHIFEMYDLAAGDNYKVMEITYTRSK
jgi:hypothetical protein